MWGSFIFQLYHCKMEMDFRQNWNGAWQDEKFRQLFIVGFAILFGILAFFPFFFIMIERRHGYVINDYLLSSFQPRNVSMLVFVIIWLTVLLAIVRCVQQPQILIVLLWGYVILNLLRILTITLVPLDPPLTLIELKDPLSNAFYGKRFITKDLFFSGHTSTMFLICLCMKQKWDKVACLFSTVTVGMLVLVQHVHYTIDVLAAILFCGPIYWLAKKVTRDVAS